MVTVKIVDSSLLITADNLKALALLESYFAKHQNVIAPPRVYEETVNEPKSIPFLTRSANRIEKLFSNGRIKIEKPDYSDNEVSDIVDRVRNCISEKSGKPVHTVERADLQIVALAVSHSKRGDSVELIFRDKTLERCLNSVFAAHGISKVILNDSSILVRGLLDRS